MMAAKLGLKEANEKLKKKHFHIYFHSPKTAVRMWVMWNATCGDVLCIFSKLNKCNTEKTSNLIHRESFIK